jgi:hypothetical protein
MFSFFSSILIGLTVAILEVSRKRTVSYLNSQPSKSYGFVCMPIRRASGLFNPLFCLGTMRQLWPTAKTGAISC